MIVFMDKCNRIDEGGSERYDPARGQEVIRHVREFFDKYIQIDGASWKNIASLKIVI